MTNHGVPDQRDDAGVEGADDYGLIALAIQYLDEHLTDQPDLDELAQHLSVSKFHLQRVFQRWAGVSPKKFLQCLTLAYARSKLAEDHPVLDVAYDAGLSSPGRLYDLTVNLLAMTPGQVRQLGAGAEVVYGMHRTPFGMCLISMTELGITGLSFVDPGDPAARDPSAQIAVKWPLASLRRDQEATGRVIAQIFSHHPLTPGTPLRAVVTGSRFQVKVWEALLDVPVGELRTYEQIAAATGNPRAAQAVGQAIGRNPLAYLIPCHRVIRKTAAFGGYRWGLERKRAIVAWEAARIAGPDWAAPTPG
jgi:AraC family transcriptional regulator of adaptative response/methylated-DNA-[protein]-cysteine methyltransferase